MSEMSQWNKNGRKSKGNIKSMVFGILSYILVAGISTGATLAVKNVVSPEDGSIGGKAAVTDNTGKSKGKIQSGEGKAADHTSNSPTSDKTAGDEKTAGFTFIDNWYMNTRTKYILDGIWHRMGNTDEILETVKKIRHTSELSWFREWNKTAERVRTNGDHALSKGHEISAAEAYLRAANYYLAAEVFLHTNPEDPRIPETYKKGADSFMKGLQLLSVPVTEVKIPYEGTTLKGYFFKASTNEAKAPILLVHQGFDAPIETTKYVAEEAIRRGYHCLLFEGPGQGMTIREQKLPFRLDWEKAVSAVVDYALTRPEVDPEKIILEGISMGGGFAVRAAEYEHRIRICIVNPGYTDLYLMFKYMLGEKLINLYEEDPKEFNDRFLEMTRYDVGLRWGIHHGMWVFGSRTPADLLTKLKEFNYEKDLDKIRCTMLIMDGTRESWGKGQAKKLYDALKSPKEYMLFTEEDFASEHCQTGGPAISTQRMFDWLDENLK